MPQLSNGRKPVGDFDGDVVITQPVSGNLMGPTHPKFRPSQMPPVNGPIHPDFAMPPVNGPIHPDFAMPPGLRPRYNPIHPFDIPEYKLGRDPQ